MTLPYEKLDPASQTQVLHIRIQELEKTLEDHKTKLAELNNLINGGILISNENMKELVKLRDYLNEELKELWEGIKPSPHDQSVIAPKTKSFWDFFK